MLMRAAIYTSANMTGYGSLKGEAARRLTKKTKARASSQEMRIINMANREAHAISHHQCEESNVYRHLLIERKRKAVVMSRLQ